MSTVRNHLTSLCSQVQCRIKPALNGIFGGMVRNNLPQTWVFQDDHQEHAAMHVDRNGNVRVLQGPYPEVDVLITLEHGDLERAITSRQAPIGAYNIQFGTVKGQRAFNYLKGEFGFR